MGTTHLSFLLRIRRPRIVTQKIRNNVFLQRLCAKMLGNYGIRQPQSRKQCPRVGGGDDELLSSKTWMKKLGHAH
jgi:hypothetical protein